MGWRRILFTMCSAAPCCNKGIQTTVLRCLSSVLASQGTNECLGDAFTCQASVWVQSTARTQKMRSLQDSSPLSHFWLQNQATLVKGSSPAHKEFQQDWTLVWGREKIAVLVPETLGLLRCTCIFHLCCPCYIKCEGAGDATAGALHVIFTLLLMTLQGLAWPSPYASRLCLLAAATTGAKWDSFH